MTRTIRRCLLALIAACLAVCGSGRADVVWSARSGWTATPDSHALRGSSEFEKGFSAYVKGRYSKARGLFTTVVKTGQEPLVERSRILVAECYLGERHYVAAFEKYEEFLDAYPASAYADRAFAGELEVVKAVLGGARVKALGLKIWSGYGLGEKVVDKISSRRPLSDYARKAQIELARSYYKRHMYIESSSAFQQYLELFGEGPEAAEALLGLGMSLLRDAPGALYDPLALYRANASLNDFTRQYPSSGAVTRAKRLADSARQELAGHYLAIGRYYVKKGRLDAARMYFSKVLREYGDTPAAVTAQSYSQELGQAK